MKNKNILILAVFALLSLSSCQIDLGPNNEIARIRFQRITAGVVPFGLQPIGGYQFAGASFQTGGLCGSPFTGYHIGAQAGAFVRPIPNGFNQVSLIGPRRDPYDCYYRPPYRNVGCRNDWDSRFPGPIRPGVAGPGPYGVSVGFY